jgi:hypothetical protein
VRLFVVLAPALLYALNRSAGLLSSSDVDFAVTTQYFMLQVGRRWGGSCPTAYKPVSVWGRWLAWRCTGKGLHALSAPVAGCTYQHSTRICVRACLCLQMASVFLATFISGSLLNQVTQVKGAHPVVHALQPPSALAMPTMRDTLPRSTSCALSTLPPTAQLAALPAPLFAPWLLAGG